MTWVNQISSRTAQSDPTRAVFNSLRFRPEKLQRFWQRLSKISTGGVDIVFIGDSIFRGLGSLSPDSASAPSLVGSILQNAWNPPGVRGGQGFLPAQWTWSSPPTQPMTATNADISGTGSRVMNGTGCCMVRLNAGGSAGSLAWSGTGVTDIEVAFLKKNGTSNTASWVMTGAETGSGNLTIQDGTSINYGHRVLIKQGMSPASAFALTISEPATDDVRLSGVVRYNGDYGVGVRFHNLSCSGVSLYDSSNNTGYLRGDEPTPGANTATIWQANIDNFTSESPITSTAIGARRGGLVVINLITNDQGNYGNTLLEVDSGAATFLSKLTTFVQYITARPSQPCVLLVIPPASSGRETLYRIFKQAVHAVADAEPHVAVLDLDRAFGEGLYSSLPQPWVLADGLHYADQGAGAIGQVMSNALLLGKRWADSNLSL